MAKVRVKITVEQQTTQTERVWFREVPVSWAWEAEVSGLDPWPNTFEGRTESEALAKAREYVAREIKDRQTKLDSARVALDETYDIA